MPDQISFVNYEEYYSVLDYQPNERGPLVVSVPFAFVHGIPKSVLVGSRVSSKIMITNTSTKRVKIWNIYVQASIPENTFALTAIEPPSSKATVEEVEAFFKSYSLNSFYFRTIDGNETFTLWLSCTPKEIGLHTTAVIFDFDCFMKTRFAFVLADDKISKSLVSRKPKIVASSTQGRGFINVLPRYDIPSRIRDEIGRKETPSAVGEGLGSDTYIPYFTTLLNMEEIQLEDEMRVYDRQMVTIKYGGFHFIYLEVPGLAQKRPSLVNGDYICAKLPLRYGKGSYQGCIHHIVGDKLYLIFAPGFLHYPCFDVEFTYNRINMRRFYQAIDATESLPKEFLFPCDFSERRYIKTNPLVPITRNINEVQMRCVQMILGCRRAPPYLVHGPPGVGKTRTLVEAILQLYTTRKSARILVCAPSNSAADCIMERLLCEESVEICDTDVFRLDASSQLYEDLKSNGFPLPFFDEQVLKSPPHNADLVHYKIVISTYTSTSLLFAEDRDYIRRGHFSHIFLDDADRAIEPETIIPLSNLCLKKTVVVLAGDLTQLGPVVYSEEAKNYGLGKSYLKRLSECKYYCTEDENYILKLFRNDILHLPSSLPSNECTVRFYGILGCNERENNNPSLFNRIEVIKVMKIINKLIVDENVIEENIGVITPYRRQVLKIRKALHSMDMVDVKVGSVEQFQSQEKQVIIVSTVRSTVEHSEFNGPGVLSNPSWFNVGAITGSAISLLVIVGNPNIICQDACWSKLLWQCVDNNSYQGSPLPERKKVRGCN